MVISVFEHSATHSAKYAVDRHTSGNETRNCYLSRSAHSEFKDKTYDPQSVLNLHLDDADLYSFQDTA